MTSPNNYAVQPNSKGYRRSPIRKGTLLVALLCAFLLVAAFPAYADEGDITTYAGGGIGDGGPATDATFDRPDGIARDAAGNLYIVDSGNHRVRQVDTNGIITTVAGNGKRGFGGDGGSATEANLTSPDNVALDDAGNLYIMDSGNYRIRKVDTNGIITTVAGNGKRGFSGDGGPATEASFTRPDSIVFDDSGNWYIADRFNHRIRMVDATGIITTVIGTGERGFGGDGGPAAEATLTWPGGMTLTEAGDLYFTDLLDWRVRKVDVSGIIATVAGNGEEAFGGDGGPATEASLDFPKGTAIDGAGNLYIADSGNDRIRKIDSSGIITTVVGNGTAGFSGDGGPATAASLSGPSSMLIDDAGNLYFSDSFNNRIRMVDTNGIISTVAGFNIRDGGPATEATLVHPRDTAFDGAGNLYIAEGPLLISVENHRIRKVDAQGTISTVVGDANGTRGFGGDGGPATAAKLNDPFGVTSDSASTLYIADTGNQRVRKVDTNGIITTVAGNGEESYGGDGEAATEASLASPSDVALDGAGNLYIADLDNNRVRKVDTNGIITTVAGNGEAGFSGDEGAATEASLDAPAAIGIDGAGNLYITDRNNNRVRKVDVNGIITTVAGNGEAAFSGDDGPAISASLNWPSGIEIDGAGNLYIADQNNNRIRKMDTNGTIMTVASNGEFGSSGDGGPAIEANLATPQGLSFDGSGNLYIADLNNKLVRKVEPMPDADAPEPNGAEMRFNLFIPAAMQ